MILALSRFICLVGACAFIHTATARAEPIIIAFTAQIGSNNNVDSGDVFGEGAEKNLAGQVIAGTISIDPASLNQECTTGPACYADFGAGAVSVSFTLNGITSTAVSTGTMGYFGGRSGGSVSISDPSDGGDNYLAVGATSSDGMVQQSIGVLFSNATFFDAYGSGDPAKAIASLVNIGTGTGLVQGGITYMDPGEHLDATILTIDVLPSADIPEPPILPLFGIAVLALAGTRRALAG